MLINKVIKYSQLHLFSPVRFICFCSFVIGKLSGSYTREKASIKPVSIILNITFLLILILSIKTVYLKYRVREAVVDSV